MDTEEQEQERRGDASRSVQVLSAKEVASSLWSRTAAEKCRLGITDTVR